MRKELRVNMRKTTQEERTEGQRCAQLLFNSTNHQFGTEEYDRILHELLGDSLGRGQQHRRAAERRLCELHEDRQERRSSTPTCWPWPGAASPSRTMCASPPTCNSSLTTDPDLPVLLCKPVHIKASAWIGAGATILPGVCVGRHAVVGAGSVVTKDVPDYAVVVGNPARVVKMLDKERFSEES